MIVRTSARRCTLPALGMALLIGTAPVAYAQCGPDNGAAMGKTSGAQQAAAATGESGLTVGQSMTTAPDSAAESEIATNQGGITTDESGTATAQPGSDDQGDAASAEAGGSGTGAPSEQTAATVESQVVSGADEERIKTMLEQEGYTEVSSIANCGSYYQASAMQDGKQETVQIILS